MEKWALHMTTDYADDNVAQWGSLAIYYLATEDTQAPWLTAGAERVLRGIIADTSEVSGHAKSEARSALSALGLKA